MTREEQIEVATDAYINGRLRNNVPPEEIEEIRLAYQAGAIYADEHPKDNPLEGILIHGNNDAYRLGYKVSIEKACDWLYKRQQVDLVVPDIEKFISEFKKETKEQQ